MRGLCVQRGFLCHGVKAGSLLLRPACGVIHGICACCLTSSNRLDLVDKRCGCCSNIHTLLHSRTVAGAGVRYLLCTNLSQSKAALRPKVSYKACISARQQDCSSFPADLLLCSAGFLSRVRAARMGRRVKHRAVASGSYRPWVLWSWSGSEASSQLQPYKLGQLTEPGCVWHAILPGGALGRRPCCCLLPQALRGGRC